MNHPSAFLPVECSGLLREEAAPAEAGRDLTLRQMELIYDRQWFRLLVPAHFGGPALSLPELVRLEEGISWADGATGWLVTLCSGAGWFAGFFPPSTRLTHLFSDDRLCLAGSGAPSGQAQRVAGGYRVSGRWAYASGALHATAFTANCVLWEQGRPLLDSTGKPFVRTFLFLQAEVNLIRDWDTVGLIATGSHAFEVKELFVPEERAFDIRPETTAANDPLYHYPFLSLAEATLAANIAGMAGHFLDCCKPLFETRRIAASSLAEALTVWNTMHAALQHCRSEFYAAVDRSWASGDSRMFEEVSRTSRELSRCARLLVDQLYPFGGLAAAKPGAEINRVWRDFHTATQHNLLTFAL